MRTIVLTEQLGIEQLTASFGLVAFVQGMTFMVDPPIAGQLYAIDESYTLPYMMAGAMYLLSCICSVVISCITRRKKTPPTDIIISVDSVETDDVNCEKV
ncbi:monocarboxylate transporter 9-like [Gigantopelta aegis]|uniref:monocarboxylate transporter 9-like n=1 Tax=Gigantopelta aegis TaxID=1735272 RepID=UPI001B88D271|nr:monocarboxylate transporter 9-like [Gigantopelta aegis]